MKSLRDTARDYAIQCHTSTNHLYDGKPYEIHLTAVKDVAVQFKHLIPSKDRDIVYAACWVHDVIEDTRQTYNDVRKVVGDKVAEIAYALTNEKGRNRKERSNYKYYEGIQQTPYAVFVKLCDRIANVKYSIETNSSMLEMYRKEQHDFVYNLYTEEYELMFDYLGYLLEPAETPRP